MPNNLDINKAIGDVSALNKEIQKTVTITGNLIKNQTELNKMLGKSKGLTDLNAKQTKAKQTQNEVEKQGNKLLGQRNTLIVKQSKALQPLTKEVIKQNEKVKEQNRLYRDQAKQDLGIKKRNGLFKSMTKSIIAASVALIGFRTVFNVFKNSLKTLATFEESMSKVRAVTGALPKEFKALTANAKLLGSTTSRTATQVAGLQLEFSKLGFSTKEILQATEATISLSIAAGTDLANSAVVAASTIRGFGLDASETQRVVDVMAKSFASSALDLEKFKTGMAIAAPVARSFGKDIEFTTARMSVLTDAGLDASTAGTSLRNIFLELTKNGLTWDEGLAKINNSTNKAATGLKLFGKRGVTAALILADNIEKAEGLEKAYDGAFGAAKDMARIMEDNLIGDTKKLSSAWEGFILNLNKGEGKLTQFFRDAVQLVTKLVGAINDLNKTETQREAEAIQSTINGEMEVYIEKIQKAIKEEENLNDVRVFKNKLVDEQIAKEKEYLDAIIKREEAEDDPAKAFDLQKSIRISTGLIAKLKELKSVIPEIAEVQVKSAETTFERVKNLARVLFKDIGTATQEFIDREEEKESFLDQALIGNPDELTVKAREVTQELIDLVNSTVDTSPVSFWDSLLALDDETKGEFLNQFVGLGNTLFDLSQAQRDRELEGIRSNYSARIQAAEGNTEVQERLTKELAIKEAEIQRKQFISEQNQAALNVLLVQTPQNVAKVFPNPFLMALAGSIGILQAGIIKGAKPPEIPGFFTGTESAPGGFAKIAEMGAELLNMPDGKSMLVKDPTIMNVPKGTQVKTAEQTQDILNRAIYNDIAVNGNEGIESRLDKMTSKLGKLKQLHVNYDINGMKIHLQEGNSKTRFMERKGRK